MTQNSAQARTWGSVASTAAQTLTKIQRSALRASERLSAMEVVESFGDRLTYRMLDYWLRAGIASCSDASRGSGSRRSFDQAEVAALADILDIREQALDMLKDFSSGELFQQRLDYHRSASRMRLINEEIA